MAVYTAAVPLLELNSSSGHQAALRAFFVPLISPALRPAAKSMLSQIISSPASPSAPDLPFVELASNLDAVVSILNEYDLHFDPLFPNRFRHYMFLVHHDLPQCVVARDHDYIRHVESTVSAIIDFDAAPASLSSLVRDIVHDLHHLQLHLLPAPHLTLLMRLAVKEADSVRLVVKSAFSVWNSRLLDAAQLLVLCDERFLPLQDSRIAKRVFSVWYNKHMRFENLGAHASHYSEQKLAAKYLNSHWIDKLLAISRSEAHADAFRMNPVFRLWKSRYFSVRALYQRQAESAAARSLTAAFSLFKIKAETLRSLDHLATEFRAQSCNMSNSALLKNAMALWSRKFTSTSSSPDSLPEKLSALGALAVSFSTGKYFRLWRVRCTLIDIAGQCKQKSNTRFKAEIFNLWKFRLQSQHVTRSLVLQRDKRIISNAFKYWRASFDDREKASFFAERKRLASIFKLWKLNYKLKATEVSRHQRVLVSIWREWILQAQAKKLRLKTQSKSKANALLSWVQAYQNLLESISKSDAIYETNSVHRTISIWVSQLEINRELAYVANLNLQRRFLQKLADKSEKLRRFDALSFQLLKNGKTFDDRFITFFVLRGWKNKYVKRFEDLSSKVADDFKLNVCNKNSLHIIFQFWNQRLRQLVRRKQILENRLQNAFIYNEMERVYFYHWSGKTVSQRQAMEQSAIFYTTLLHKKYLLAWYEKYVAKVDYLLDVSDDLRNQRDYNCLLDSLRKWNLNLIKHVQRNNQTCTIFRAKWEKSNMKSLFQLWLHKTRKRESGLGDEEDEEYAEANATFGSNLSPLSRKYPKAGSSSMLDTTSYLNTPVKRQVQNLFTPQNRKGPSPTRLQETNQRMKIDKMDALINHYKLAKKASKGSSTRLTKTVRLSPPKLNFMTPHMAAKPPAPQFEPHSSSESPEATSSPSLLAGDSEISVLNTAKKLNKIKPLVIPPEKDREFRLTSVSKLRARLQQREGVKIEPSNVFDDMN